MRQKNIELVFTSIAKFAKKAIQKTITLMSNAYKKISSLKNKVNMVGEKIIYKSKKASNILAEALIDRAFSTKLAKFEPSNEWILSKENNIQTNPTRRSKL